MGYKSNLLSRMAEVLAEDAEPIIRGTNGISKSVWKFVKDAFLTEVVPKELKSKLKNYDPDSNYIRKVRPALKIMGQTGVIVPLVTLTKDLPNTTQNVIMWSSFGCGFVDFAYEFADSLKNPKDPYLAPATWPIELGYNIIKDTRDYFSDLGKRTRFKTYTL